MRRGVCGLDAEASELCAAIVCLAHAPFLANYALHGYGAADVNRRRARASAFALALYEFIRTYWSAGSGDHDHDHEEAVDASAVADALAKHQASSASRIDVDDDERALELILSVLDAATKAGARHCVPERGEAFCPAAWRDHGGGGGDSTVRNTFQFQLGGEDDSTGAAEPSAPKMRHAYSLGLRVSESTTLHHAIDATLKDLGAKFNALPPVLVLRLARTKPCFVGYTVDFTVPAEWVNAPRGEPRRYALFAVDLLDDNDDDDEGEAVEKKVEEEEEEEETTQTARRGHAALCEAGGAWHLIRGAECRRVADLNALVQKNAVCLMYKLLPE